MAHGAKTLPIDFGACGVVQCTHLETTGMRLHRDAVRLKGGLSAICSTGLAISSLAAGMSSMSATAYFDTHETPLGRAVGGDGAVPVSLAGDWFASGECELYVDGVLAATSSGALQSYALAGAADTWKTYRLTLKSAEGEQTKIVTVYPYAGYVCPLHSLSARADFLDARPAETVRRVRFDKTIPVTWSGAWTNESDRAVVRLYGGVGTNGTLVAELVDSEGRGEGEYTLSPLAAQLPVGRYTLTHFDGVETLFADLKISGGAVMIVR